MGNGAESSTETEPIRRLTAADMLMLIDHGRKAALQSK
jgi:hypothetical protein